MRRTDETNDLITSKPVHKMLQTAVLNRIATEQLHISFASSRHLHFLSSWSP